ncbi:PTS system, mannose-specific IIB component [Paenibacillus sp. UNCCL117]|uniref:PTS system mannose/fructose/N-acetylgalactosamine-transporter subunit IIB n=1 Tax=unclassified Paenibacillus TaxID=185978 RepID=UPI000889A634|nr:MULTISPECIES: PTS sugar transporter subunit IIB [unclassified Paenibacillus]SDD32599.1 PTS system, mannose-specific IIB component [Paenibacillus sp. cl123]SFW39781.1 PTS system, mannose-specific IIB component [Paenibacillus sp. UNCCL117]
MKIVLVRVDDRLIHGEVAVGWTRILGATHIVVANDQASTDNTQKMLLKMATPVGVKSTVLSVADAAQQLSAAKFKNDKVLVLVRDPQSLLGLMEGGLNLEQVNVANVRMAEGRQRITKEVAASPEEIAAWKELDRRDVKLEARLLPGSAPNDFGKIIRSL